MANASNLTATNAKIQIAIESQRTQSVVDPPGLKLRPFLIGFVGIIVAMLPFPIGIPLAANFSVKIITI